MKNQLKYNFGFWPFCLLFLAFCLWPFCVCTSIKKHFWCKLWVTNGVKCRCRVGTWSSIQRARSLNSSCSSERAFINLAMPSWRSVAFTLAASASSTVIDSCNTTHDTTRCSRLKHLSSSKKDPNLKSTLKSHRPKSGRLKSLGRKCPRFKSPRRKLGRLKSRQKFGMLKYPRRKSGRLIKSPGRKCPRFKSKLKSRRKSRRFKYPRRKSIW